MENNSKILIVLCASLLLSLTLVSAHNFVLNNQVVLQGTTFSIDNLNFRQLNSSIQVRLDLWYTLCPESYHLSNNLITMLESVVCDTSNGSPVCSQAGGGCGGS